MKKIRLAILVVSIVSLFPSYILVQRVLANHFLQKGIQLRNHWELEQAIRYFEWSLRLHDSVEAKYQKGITYHTRGEFRQSQKELEYLLKQDLDRSKEAHIWNIVGSNHFHFNEPDAAILAHIRSLDLAKEIGDSKQEAEALTGWSRVLYHLRGDSEQALQMLERALSIAQNLNEKRLAADALRHLGAIYLWHKGEVERPLKEYFLPALAIYEQIHDLHGVSITLSNIGLAHSVNGDVFQALNYFNRSIDLKMKTGFLSGLCDSYSQMGMIYSGLNEKKALYFYRESLDLSRRIGYRLTENEVESHLANAYFEAGELDQAIALLNDLIQRDQANPMMMKYRLGALAKVQLANGDLQTALQNSKRSLELNDAAHDSRFLIGVLLLSARIQIKLEDYEKARLLVAQVEELMRNQTEKYWPEVVDLKVVLSKLLEHEGNFVEATRYLLEAVEIESHVFESSRTRLIQGRHRELYDRLFPLLLKEDRDPATAFSVLEQMRYRSFRNLIVQTSSTAHASRERDKEEEALSRIERLSELLRKKDSSRIRKELEAAYFEYEDLILKAELDQAHRSLIQHSRPVFFEQIQEVLDPHTAIVQYVFAGDGVFCLVAKRNKLQSFLLPVTAANLEAKVKLFRSLILNNAVLNDWLPVAKNLRSILIDPLESTNALEGVRSLALIPAGTLHHLPFAALARSENNEVKYLIQDYTMFRIPSAAYLHYRLNASTGQKTLTRDVISFGRNHSDEPELPLLRFAEEEARAVASLFQGALRIDRNATETELKKNAPKFRYIHFASHAVSEPQMPLLSRIKLQRTKQDDGNLTIPEILSLPLHADLVTLGACRTGQSFSHGGKEQNDLDRIGLMESFLFAGAKSVVATLLPIDDRATIYFMTDFYRNLAEHTKAEALSLTQRRILQGKTQGSDFSHPRYWAPFVLVGDSR